MISGASCLPFDNSGQRVSQTLGYGQPFKNLIADRVRDENWTKRRAFVLFRERGASVYDMLVMRVVDLTRGHIVGFS